MTAFVTGAPPVFPLIGTCSEAMIGSFCCVVEFVGMRGRENGWTAEGALQLQLQSRKKQQQVRDTGGGVVVMLDMDCKRTDNNHHKSQR